MKKMITGLMLLGLMATSLVGCGSNNAAASTSPSASNAPSAAASAAPSADAPTAGGNPIVVITREAGSGTRGAFIELFGVEEKGEDGSKTDKTIATAITANKTDVVLTQVQGNPDAIGYISLGSLNNSVKALKIDGVEATSENVKNGTYKAARPFYIATNGEGNELTKDFIAFIMSQEGQAVISESYIAVDDAAAAYAGSKPAGKIVVAGSSSVTPVMEKLIEAYKQINTGAQIELQQSDSSAGMQSAMDGVCDIGMASRELKDTEKAALTPTQIAIDGIAVIVNQNNAQDDMSSEDVKAIYTGEKTAW